MTGPGRADTIYTSRRRPGRNRHMTGKEGERMIRHVIFDMGNVLIQWDPEEIIQGVGAAGADARLLRREVFDGMEWVAMDHGTMSQDEGLRHILARLPERLHGQAERCVRDWWKAELRPTEGIEALIRELRELGCGLYILSNATSQLHEYCHRLPGWDCFQGMIVSADWGLMKPEPAIYERLFSAFGLQPGDCFFIDDNPMNIEGARCAGMPGAVFFNDLPRLRRELNAAGIPVKAEA